MTRVALLFAGSAALALAACGDTDDAADETTIIETETTEPAPVVTETTTVIEDRTDGDDSVTISEDGVQADVDDGDTEVTVDVDEDPSVRVRD